MKKISVERRQLNKSRAKAKKLIQKIVKQLQEEHSLINVDGTTEPTGGSLLWRVLTGLRGPDNHDEVLKKKTTMLVRHAIGMTMSNAGGAMVSSDNPEPGEYNTIVDSLETFPKADFHFKSHYGLAVEALGKLGFI